MEEIVRSLYYHNCKFYFIWAGKPSWTGKFPFLYDLQNFAVVLCFDVVVIDNSSQKNVKIISLFLHHVHYGHDFKLAIMIIQKSHNFLHLFVWLMLFSNNLKFQWHNNNSISYSRNKSFSVGGLAVFRESWLIFINCYIIRILMCLCVSV
jgi:hypothetical protein